VGGEDSISSLHHTKLLGSLRTYAYVGKPDVAAAKSGRNPKLRAENWIGALKEGRTFFTSGPLLELTVNAAGPGETIKLPTTGQVVVKAQVWSVVPLSRVVIYRNGEVWRELPLDAGGRGARLHETVRIDKSAWFSLTAEGPERSHPLDALFPQAATNAVRVYVGTQKIRNSQSAQYFVRWIEKLQAMASAWPGWRSDKEKAHVLGQFSEASGIYRRLASESGEAAK
jgi:hypothetical protein